MDRVYCPASLRQNPASLISGDERMGSMAPSIKACSTPLRPSLRWKPRRQNLPRIATEIMTAAHRARRTPPVW